ncbi:MAG: hypothetical protein HY544_01165 [Candidatus Diapherotrites archaeon]|uniref:Uncharacterized protein n=1 Tax=Candidatus Iainarchaeum sp. TaxID=3101447 RepID=A0A8T3YJX7_9ARCH|nr:hypothetical protein [Candidatus Diapherotrites archaeon]
MKTPGSRKPRSNAGFPFGSVPKKAPYANFRIPGEQANIKRINAALGRPGFERTLTAQFSNWQTQTLVTNLINAKKAVNKLKKVNYPAAETAGHPRTTTTLL